MSQELLPVAKRMKSLERAFDLFVEPNSIVAIRADGNSFKTYTKDFARPFDLSFMKAMDKAAKDLCESASGVMFAYVQSDEITVFTSDLSSAKSQHWFGGKVQKMSTIAAGIVSSSLSRSLPKTKLAPAFDARVLQLKTRQDVSDYLHWRRNDASKNAITMAASCVASHKQLHGVSTGDRVALLEGTVYDVDKLPEGFVRGRIIMREFYSAAIDPRFSSEQAGVTRSRWTSNPASMEIVEKALKTVPVKP